MSEGSRKASRQGDHSKLEFAYAEMAGNSSLKMWMTHADGRCHFVNQAWADYVGQPIDSQIDNGWAQLLHQDDAGPARDAMRSAARVRAPFHHEYRLRRHDGQYRWHQDLAVPRFSNDGTFLGYLGSLIDIHDNKQANSAQAKELLERNAQIDALLDSTSTAVIAADLCGKILINNSLAIQLTGLRDEDFPEDMSAWCQALGLHHPDGKMLEPQDSPLEIALGGEVIADRELLIRNERNGDGVRVEAGARPLVDRDGRRIGAILVLSDITERLAKEMQSEQMKAQFHALFNQAHLFNGLLTTEGVLFWVNGPTLAATGWSEEQCLNMPFWDAAWWRHAEDTQEFTRRAIAAALRGESHKEIGDYYCKADDGNPIRRRLEFFASPVHDSNGKIINIFIAGQDITEQEKQKAALEESEARFRGTTDAAPQIVWVAGPTGRFEFINRFGLEFYGMRAEDAAGDGWLRTVHPEDRPALTQRMSECAESGAPLELQCRIRRHDGVYHWHIARGIAQLNENGQVIRWHGIFSDIEELRKAQNAAEAAAEAKSQFLANMSHEIRTPMNGVIGMTGLLDQTKLDDEQREYVTTIRHSGEHLLSVINDILDFSKADAGKLQLESYSFGLRSCVEEALELVASNAHTKNIELILDAAQDIPLQVVGDAGRLRQVLVNLLSNAIKFSEKGDVIVRLHVIPEATDAHRWRLKFSVQDYGVGIPEERMDRLFGVFSQVDASHTRLYGGSGLGLAICKRLVEHMSGRIWAESTAGEGSTFFFEVELGQTDTPCESNVEMLRGKKVIVVDDNPTNLRVLRLMLESWGLDVTAVPDATSMMRIVTEHKFDVALLDHLMPQMTGIELARVLRSMAQTNDLPMMLLGSITEANDSENLDLFFTRMLKPVRQSTLLDQLTRLFSGIRSARRQSDTSYPKPGVVHSLRVLVAEDNIVNQKVTLALLKRMGYQADLVANGLEVLETIKAKNYDLILMDVQMPEMDGFEATRRIRQQHANDPNAPTPRIVAVTANALPGDEQVCREAGMDDYLRKPIEFRELSAAMIRATQASLARKADSSATSSSDCDDYQEGMIDSVEIFDEPAECLELIGSMRDDLARQTDELGQALANQDRAQAARIAHSLKSVTAMVRARTLSAELQALESELLNGDFPASAAGLEQCMLRCKALFSALLEENSGRLTG